MKITYECSENIAKGEVVYRKSENSFDFISHRVGDISILIGYLQLGIDSETNHLISLWGLHPFRLWKQENLNVPHYVKGIVEINNNYQSPFAYREADLDEWKTYYDCTSGWVCVGDKDAEGIPIMYATDIIVVFDENSLKSVWAKPRFI